MYCSYPICLSFWELLICPNDLKFWSESHAPNYLACKKNQSFWIFYYFLLIFLPTIHSPHIHPILLCFWPETQYFFCRIIDNLLFTQQISCLSLSFLLHAFFSLARWHSLDQPSLNQRKFGFFLEMFTYIRKLFCVHTNFAPNKSPSTVYD